MSRDASICGRIYQLRDLQPAGRADPAWLVCSLTVLGVLYTPGRAGLARAPMFACIPTPVRRHAAILDMSSNCDTLQCMTGTYFDAGVTNDTSTPEEFRWRHHLSQATVPSPGPNPNPNPDHLSQAIVPSTWSWSRANASSQNFPA